ncbi:MAG: caspase family protein [Thermodesulfobacteriota bacterium]
MKTSTLPFFLVLLVGLSGCYYNVKMPPVADIQIQPPGTPLPSRMSLYLSPQLKSHVWVGRAMNFETKAYRFEIPLGPSLANASRDTFESLFTHVSLVDKPEIQPGTVGLIIPSLNSYYFGVYDRIKSAGTLRSFVSMNCKIIDGQGKTVWEGNVEGSGERQMTNYFKRPAEWNDNLPLTSRDAIEDCFRKLAGLVADSPQVKEYAANPPPVVKPVVPPPPPPPPPPVIEKPKEARLYVKSDPEDARIRILNIRPVYRPGMELPGGSYHLEVSKPGYQTRTEWIRLTPDEERHVEMALAKLDSPPAAEQEEALPAPKAPVSEPVKTAAPATVKAESPPLKKNPLPETKPEAPPPETAKNQPREEESSLFSFLSPSETKEEAPPPLPARQYWAVVIGISAYSDTRIPSLRYATADARSLYNWLVSPKGGKYPPRNVTLLLDRQATGRNIKNALFNWLRQALEEDVVIIYFAGHGSPDTPDTPDNLYLLPYDTQYDNIAATGFPMWDIETALKRFIHAKTVVVVADACHSGGVGQSFDVARRSIRALDVNPIAARLEQLSEISGGVAVISASGDRQTSQEGKQWGGGHGVFTHFFMQGLNGDADYNNDQRVTLGELIPYLSEQVRRATRSAQSPTVAGKFDPALSIGR